ncbi:LOW QUALITY PROTEIN: uncharacterized protein LOC119146337 [Falco rusticolus]|uniref:LOW QUALITY PROTEIN: uncharacterized protein LOC119146337 n=1 Tax=Falco rusticolus TaxID=120794 RepID=UPI00188654EE|nr:LOW QUALITY PROTEIN: uncharacterized protein LOC119146337 [Falco rusticolus]
MALIVLAALAGLAAFGHAQKDSVLQFPAEMTIQRGHSTALRCNFSTSLTNPYIFWYQQRQTAVPQMLLQECHKWKPQVDSGRFSSSLSVEDSQVVLHVRDAELQDSAAYFCALSPQWCPQHAAAHRNMGGAMHGSAFGRLIESEVEHEPSAKADKRIDTADTEPGNAEIPFWLDRSQAEGIYAGSSTRSDHAVLFDPEKAQDWNALSINVVQALALDVFKTRLDTA